MSVITDTIGKLHIPIKLGALNQISGSIGLIFKRQRFHKGLTILALISIILAVGLATNVSFFSQAVNRLILTQNLKEFSRVTGRPPFSTSVYIFPSASYPITLQIAEDLSRTISGILSGSVGLPVRQVGLEVSSGGLMLQPVKDSRLYTEGQNYLDTVEAVYLADVAGHIQVTEGDPYTPDGESGAVMDVWMHDNLMQKTGVQVGELLQVGLTVSSAQVPIRLAGFWKSIDPKEEYWFTDPDTSLQNSLLVRRSDYLKFIQPMVHAGSREASWYIILDETKVLPQNGAAYLDGFKKALSQINRTLPGTSLNTPPLAPLEDFVNRSNTLTILLLGYNVPAFAILLYFLALTSGIIAKWQRKETTMLVSRGMTIRGILSMVVIEQSLMFVVGLPLGVGLGMLIAWLMSFSATFLTFTQRTPLPVALDGLSIPLAALALLVSLLARIWPAIQVARGSVVTEEREWARPSRGPVWYRFYLDLLLIIPTYYFYSQMARQGSLANLVVDNPDDLFRDPLLVLIPALFIVTASLMSMRLFSLLMRLLDLLAGLPAWFTLHLTLRQLGRQSHDYIQPILLVIVSLAMGVYTLSMAASLDQWLVDRIDYRVGADLAFTPQPLMEGTDYIDGNWIPGPAELRRVPGVVQATRVVNFTARLNSGSRQELVGRFMGIDRLEFPQVAFFRPDFANESLGDLINRLALTSDGVLVSSAILERSGLQPGDQITAQVSNNDVKATLQFTIVGTYDYFPTVYNEERLTMVGNMDYLTSQFGFTVPHDIWMKLEPGVQADSVIKALPGVVGISSNQVKESRALISAEQAKTERVGIFGTLSTGFLAASIMAILGLLIYSYASLRDRVYRFGVLNAVGVSRRQIMAQLILEYTFLVLFGVLAGALIGNFASELFVPFFRFTGEQGVPLPPLLPIIADQQVLKLVVVFTGTIILAELVTVALAFRQQLGKILR